MTYQYHLVLQFDVDDKTSANDKAHEFARAITNHAPRPYSVVAEILNETDNGIVLRRTLWAR